MAPLNVTTPFLKIVKLDPSISYQSVHDFWFKELKPASWFKKDLTLDQTIKSRFKKTHELATQSTLDSWRQTARGALSEVIVLDQFSRNIYREDPQAFASDPLALALSQEAIRRGLEQSLSLSEKSFLYMPFMHSESLAIHEQAVKLFSENGLENNLQFELRHKAILERFGRYPHRNEVLGRPSTPAEIEFLKQPGSSF